jgi:hypothetical protein
MQIDGVSARSGPADTLFAYRIRHTFRNRTLDVALLLKHSAGISFAGGDSVASAAREGADAMRGLLWPSVMPRISFRVRTTTGWHSSARLRGR